MHSQPNLFQVSPESSPTPDCSLAGQQSGDVLKRRGMKRARQGRWVALEAAKDAAFNIALCLTRPITIDDVFHFVMLGHEKPRITPESLGNAAGSVFKGPEWEFVEFVKSTRPSNHSRYVRSWRLK